MARILHADAHGFADAYQALIAERAARMDHAEVAARDAIAAVRAGGVEALLALTEQFDGVRLAAADLRVTPAEIDASLKACAPDLVAALELAAARISAFHERGLPQDARWTDDAGVSLGWRWTPVDAAGLYAPGGRAAYPSSILMNALAAKAAGVKRLAMATPPARLGENPAILAAAKIAGVDEIWRIGGAQAIAALAYGAGPIAAVDVIVGPGNAFVSAAKRQVFGDVGIDSVAGPSEVFIVSDATADPAWLAADLLAQAEHDTHAQSVLFTADPGEAEAVSQAVAARLAMSGGAGASAARAWAEVGAIVIVATLADAIPLIDAAAPEHVQLACEPGLAERLAAGIRHAGAIFLGAHAPEALGDYLAGPNHVLPTSRRARFSSGLSAFHFLKRTTLIGAGPHALARLAEPAARLADAEGLPAHAASLRLRLKP